MELEEKIAEILARVDLSGFTELVEGSHAKRYVVAFTHNGEWSLRLLACQVRFYAMFYDNVTLG